MTKFMDITGQKFGRLLVLEFAEKRGRPSSKYFNMFWKCRCDCGNIKIILGTSLRCGKTKSCGCLQRDNAKTLAKRSGRIKPSGHSARNKLRKKYEAQAGYRGLEFKLSKEQFYELTKQNCYYCGQEPSQVVNMKGCNGTYTYNGVDRVDNTKGYTIDNCVSCCVTCNKSKMEMTVDEFYAWIDRVYYHRHTDLASEFNAFFSNGFFDELEEEGIPK